MEWSKIILMLYVLIIFFICVIIFRIYMLGKERRKQYINIIESLQIGKKAITVGGIHGTISKILDDTVELKIDKGVFMTLSKDSIVWVEK